MTKERDCGSIDDHDHDRPVPHYDPHKGAASLVCERIVIPDRLEAEREISVANRWWIFSTRFNVGASHRVPAARIHENESEGVMLQWGLIPASTEPDSTYPGALSVDDDAIDASYEYRNVWLQGQRCIVPIAGYYVWKRIQAGHRQPFYVRLTDRPVFGVAALWDRFVNEEDDVIEGCAFITVQANPLVARLDRRGRMPVILHRNDYDTWLSAKPGSVNELLRTYPEEHMAAHPVSPHVNFLKFDGPNLIRPIA